MPQQMKLPNNVIIIKKKLIEKGFTSQELNDEIILEMKKDFDNIGTIELVEGRTRSDVCLNRTQEKFFEMVNKIYGITFTQLYTRSIIKIAKQEKII